MQNCMCARHSHHTTSTRYCILPNSSILVLQNFDTCQVSVGQRKERNNHFSNFTHKQWYHYYYNNHNDNNKTGTAEITVTNCNECSLLSSLCHVFMVFIDKCQCITALNDHARFAFLLARVFRDLSWFTAVAAQGRDFCVFCFSCFCFGSCYCCSCWMWWAWVQHECPLHRVHLLVNYTICHRMCAITPAQCLHTWRMWPRYLPTQGPFFWNGIYRLFDLAVLTYIGPRMHTTQYISQTWPTHRSINNTHTKNSVASMCHITQRSLLSDLLSAKVCTLLLTQPKPLSHCKLSLQHP